MHHERPTCARSAASPSPISLTPARSFPARAQPQLSLLASATAPGWRLVLATVPTGVDQVQVSVSSGNESAGETLVRPRF